MLDKRKISSLFSTLLMLQLVPVAASQEVQSEDGTYQARALIRSPQRIEYRSEITAPVKSAEFLQGAIFRKGDVLVEMECSRYEAEKRAAEATANAASIELKTKKRLYKYQAAGKNEVDMAAAHFAEAKAQLQVHKVRNQSCRFEAPFDGRVVSLNVMPHEFPPVNEPMIVVIDDAALEMELVVPSKWLVWIKPGAVFEILIDETGESGRGKIERIAAEVDPVSQTVELIASFSDRPSSVLAGMSGSVTFQNLLN